MPRYVSIAKTDPSASSVVLVRPSDNKIFDFVAESWIAAPSAPGSYDADVFVTGSLIGIMSGVTFTIPDEAGDEWSAWVFDSATPVIGTLPIAIVDRPTLLTEGGGGGATSIVYTITDVRG